MRRRILLVLWKGSKIFMSKYKSYILAGGRCSRGLEHYVLMDYGAGEILDVSDWVAEGYKAWDISRSFARAVKAGWLVKLRKGVFQVL